MEMAQHTLQTAVQPEPLIPAAQLRRRERTWKAAGATAAAVAAALGCTALVVASRSQSAAGGSVLAAPKPPLPSRMAVAPKGVNFGGWLCLEDWFFSGSSGINVMSLHPEGQGACLPPQVTGLKETWPSEGILTKRLVESQGVEAAATAFEAHRHSYITDSDLAQIASLGIKTIRVPLTWAVFADELARLDWDAYGSHNPETTTAIVPDPFYTEQAAFATVPRAWLAGLLRRAAHYNLKVLLDLHAFPGGSADGTYNGIWPNRPAFWTQPVNQTHFSKKGANVHSNISLQEVGHWITEGLVRWLEGLNEELDGVAGVTFMNEPAHMASIEKNQGNFFANETEVLAWLAQSAQLFRSSSLPSKGLKLYVNLIETAFDNFQTAITWFSKTFSEAERNRWAVIDVHWYTAWSGGSCDGRVVSGGGYFCDAAIEEVREKVRGCVRGFTQAYANYNFPSGLRATSEFSLGTFQDATQACQDHALLDAFLEEQVQAFNDYNIEAFFWTWRMPYGRVFQPGWSLKHHAGFEEPQSVLPCGPALVGP